jgi:cyclopropane fatty-acyl-phospholipid synthase-like methyltransferase
MAFIEQTPPGRALDLGCGTGTNAITLARRKWQVTAIDFSVKAIASARRKASAAGLDIDFRRGDVSDLSGVEGPFDYALDIGCLFTLSPQARRCCIDALAGLVPAGGRYMLYSWLSASFGGKVMGMAPEEVSALMTPYFRQDRMVEGREGQKASAWYWFTRI